MTQVDLSKVPAYLQSRRWFGGKAWPIKQVTIVDHVPFETGAVQAVLAVVEVTYELGSAERYLLPLVPRANGEFKDALDNDDVVQLLLRVVQSGSQVPAGAGVLKGERMADAAVQLDALPEEPALRRINSEQSNTSIIFADKAMMKLIRKLEPGVNPEYEMGRFFAEHRKGPGPARVPRMLGALQLDGPSPMTLGVIHEFIPSQGDGWGYVVDAFKQIEAQGPALLGEVETLGKRLGELHRILASEPNDPAFAPEPLGREDLQRWSSSIVGELGVALSLASESVPSLMDRRAPLTARAQKLAHVEPSGQKIRVHGDLHLGQVLFTPGSEADWIIFDFEGEPLRPFNQRREKHCALKDVAGMLRSFSYAAATAELNDAAAAKWIPQIRTAFLKGYHGATDGAAFIPKDSAFDTVLDALELEKLLYELRYELQHRPNWVSIPAKVLMSLEQEAEVKEAP